MTKYVVYEDNIPFDWGIDLSELLSRYHDKRYEIREVEE